MEILRTVGIVAVVVSLGWCAWRNLEVIGLMIVAMGH